MQAIQIIGNLVEDPELRITPSGRSVTHFRVASNRRYIDKTGETQEEATFLTCNVWGDQAEHVAQSLQKGMRVVIIGRLNQRSWEDDYGRTRTVIEVAVDECGPSLRWATAQVTKVARKTGDEVEEE